MGRAKRIDAGGLVYHVLNRGHGRTRIFRDDDDYAAFERVLAEAVERFAGVRLCAYCLMPNHWHLVLWPREDGQLSRFVGWLTLTHTQRWNAHRRGTGGGHVYQGRYKSFPIQRDDHFLTVCRYVERNALRAGRVDRAEDWPWSSLWLWRHPGEYEDVPALSRWPVERPRRWAYHVNRPQTAAELEALRRSVNRGSPYGGPSWVRRTARELNLETTLRPRGRPKMTQKGS
jgi:putative transposase